MFTFNYYRGHDHHFHIYNREGRFFNRLKPCRNRAEACASMHVGYVFKSKVMVGKKLKNAYFAPSKNICIPAR